MRSEKRVSQQKVADAVNISQQSIHRYENGDYEPDIKTLKLLADYFETSIDFLVGRTEIRNKIEPVEKYALNKEESKLIDRFRELTPEYKKYHTKVLDELTKVTVYKK